MALVSVNSRLLYTDSHNLVVTPEKQDFVNRLIELCEMLHYPERGRQTQLAQRYKLKQPSVRKWFTGEAMPAYEIASDLCKRAMVNYEWLMTGRSPKMFSHESMDPTMRKGIQLLTAMEPAARYKAVRVLDSLSEPAENQSPADGTNGVPKA
jgi:hypothetical protein